MAEQNAPIAENETQSAVQQPKQSSSKKAKSAGYPRLLDGDLWRVLENDGVDGVGHFAVYALHADEQGLAYPSDWSVARMCDLKDRRTVEKRNARFVDRGLFEYATKNGKPAMLVLHCDGSQEYSPLIRQFFEDYVAPHDDLRTMEVPEWVPDGPDKVWVGPKALKKPRYVWLHPVRDGLGVTGLGLYYSVIAAGRMMGAKCWNSRIKFRMRVKELCRLLRMSRGQFDRARKVIEDFGLLETTQVGQSVDWNVAVQGARGVPPQKSSPKMRGSEEMVSKNAEQAEKSSPKKQHEVDFDLEVDLNAEVHQTQDLRHDMRSPKNGDANPHNAASSGFSSEALPAGALSHDPACVGGMITGRDRSGNLQASRCPVCLASDREKLERDRVSAAEAERQRIATLRSTGAFSFSDMFLNSPKPMSSALRPAQAIEGAWREVPSATHMEPYSRAALPVPPPIKADRPAARFASAAARYTGRAPVIAGRVTVFGAFLFDVFRVAIEGALRLRLDAFDQQTNKRINGLLRELGNHELEKFDVALRMRLTMRREKNAKFRIKAGTDSGKLLALVADACGDVEPESLVGRDEDGIPRWGEGLDEEGLREQGWCA